MQLSDVVGEHRTRLSCLDRSFLAAFEARLSSARDGAIGEAVTFHFLEHLGLAPRVLETPSSGGLDFECSFGGRTFAVETTALLAETVAERSGVPLQIREGGGGYAGAAIVPLIRSRVSDKTRHAWSYDGPCVLVVSSTHHAATALFAVAAAPLLLGDVQISFDLHAEGAVSQPYLTTQLANAAYLRERDGEIQAFRKRYAYLLLMAVHDEGAHIRGIANPAPAHSLSAEAFHKVPLLTLQWPPQGDTLRTKWTNGDRNPLSIVF